MKNTTRVDRLLSVCAIIAAITAVAIAVYEARITREYQKISVWPYVMQYNEHIPGQTDYTRNIANNGIGPAVIRSFRVYVDGEPQQNWNGVLNALIGEQEPALIYSSMHRGKVLLPGVAEAIMRLPAGERATRFWQATQGGRFVTQLCYCSLYDECWVARGGAGEPEAVRECAVGLAGEFQQ